MLEKENTMPKVEDIKLDKEEFHRQEPNILILFTSGNLYICAR